MVDGLKVFDEKMRLIIRRVRMGKNREGSRKSNGNIGILMCV